MENSLKWGFPFCRSACSPKGGLGEGLTLQVRLVNAVLRGARRPGCLGDALVHHLRHGLRHGWWGRRLRLRHNNGFHRRVGLDLGRRPGRALLCGVQPLLLRGGGRSLLAKGTGEWRQSQRDCGSGKARGI